MSIVDPIEKEEHVVINPSDWIAKGKDYKGAPLHVQNACTVANTLPLDVLGLLPDNDTPILNFSLPTQLAALSTFSDHGWFYFEEPTVLESTAAVQIIRSRTIPPRDVISKLEAAFGQKWLDSYKSISDHL